MRLIEEEATCPKLGLSARQTMNRRHKLEQPEPSHRGFTSRDMARKPICGSTGCRDVRAALLRNSNMRKQPQAHQRIGAAGKAHLNQSGKVGRVTTYRAIIFLASLALTDYALGGATGHYNKPTPITATWSGESFLNTTCAAILNLCSPNDNPHAALTTGGIVWPGGGGPDINGTNVVTPLLTPRSSGEAASCTHFADSNRSLNWFAKDICSECRSIWVMVPSYGGGFACRENFCPANGDTANINNDSSSESNFRSNVRRLNEASSLIRSSLASAAARSALAARSSAFAARSSVSDITLAFSSRRAVSILPTLDATTSSPKTPTKTIASPMSPSHDECGHMRSKILCGRNRSIRTNTSTARPPRTTAVQNRSQRERPSDQFSSSLRMSVFGIPRRRRRSLGLIEFVVWGLTFVLVFAVLRCF